jgi:hypothetical protein
MATDPFWLFGMVQGEVTPTVAGVCDPGRPTTAGLRESSHESVPIRARAEKPGATQTRSLLNHAGFLMAALQCRVLLAEG